MRRLSTQAASLRGPARLLRAPRFIPTRGDRLVAQWDLRKSDFGIRQVTALLGALKVRDAVQVTVDLPDPRPSAGAG